MSTTSPLYAKLLREAAKDVLLSGVCLEVLLDHENDPPGSALALRFLGAIHRLVLEGNAPDLAACYPSVGGYADRDDLWLRFQTIVHQHTKELRELIRVPVQTNEVTRCAALLGGFLEVVRCTSLPVRLLEIGAAAGLILRWDHYRYEQDNDGWGDPRSPVHISSAFENRHPSFSIQASITERSGCDNFPIDPTTEVGRLTLKSYVWPDQLERFHLLEAAIQVAQVVPAHLSQTNAADWIEGALATRWPGVATVIYHSIVWQYLSQRDRSRIQAAITAAGQSASVDRPLAWLTFEPGRDIAEVRLRLWPGGDDRLLARSGFHGRPVHWLGKTDCAS